MGTRNTTLVSGNWAALPKQGTGQGLAAQCEELSYYFFFFAAFAGFLAAAFAGFFAAFLAVAILSLLEWSLGCLLASELAPSEVESSPIGNPTQRICTYTILSRECSTSSQAIVDCLSESDLWNGRHGDRSVSRVEHAQHREEVRRSLGEVTANRKVERR